jgi:hypothetical protein
MLEAQLAGSMHGNILDLRQSAVDPIKKVMGA